MSQDHGVDHLAVSCGHFAPQLQRPQSSLRLLQGEGVGKDGLQLPIDCTDAASQFLRATQHDNAVGDTFCSSGRTTPLEPRISSVKVRLDCICTMPASRCRRFVSNQIVNSSSNDDGNRWFDSLFNRS